MTKDPVENAAALARTCLLAAAVACLAAPTRADPRIDVKIDEAKIIELPEKTSTVVLGNPIVADVTLLKANNKAVLTGRGFGQTNLIALDSAGNTLGETVVHVLTGFKGLIVQRGLERESYSCEPRCQPTVVLGDTTKFMGETGGAIQTHAGMATSGGGGGGAPPK
jgi:hypothetical protein